MQVDNIIDLILLIYFTFFIFFWLKLVKSDLFKCYSALPMLKYQSLFKNFFFFYQESAFFTFQRKLKKNILYFCSATQAGVGSYAAVLFLTLTLLLTPTETVCQSNHAPSQTSQRVEC